MSTTGSGAVDGGGDGGGSGGRLADRVAVVTGAANGLGAAIARRFAAEGARVVVADIQDDDGTALVDELGSIARYAHCDVTDEAQVAAAVDLAVAEFGRLDVMVNNAGVVGATGSIAETSSAAWDATMAILLGGVFAGTKHAARVMIPQGSGAIVNTSSVAGVIGGLGPHAYTTAKHAVVGLTRSTANELAASGIRVNAISPGSIVTAMTATVAAGGADRIDAVTDLIAGQSPLGYAGLPTDIAAAALYLASDDARYVSGHTLVVDAGLTTSGLRPSPFHTGPSRQYHEAGRITDDD